ncbi:unnamed protein product [Linum tenue]|uniref:Uncharacterized protein n=1 Tax=Linum tenue TaxID=586396 RepID=A0AAV0J6V7_9ROSI|nr:unnamed protein product [Linum tenue]
MGHIIPLVEFSRKLVLLHPHECTATIIIPSLGPPPEAQRQLAEPIRLPGCRFAFPVGDLHPSILDRKSDAYERILRHAKRQRLADGFIVNTFMEVEGEIIEALRGEEFANGRPIFPIGPIIQSTITDDGRRQNECLEWLDSQPPASVLFVSFGSGGTLSQEQLTELALGLEMSHQQFLWVVRSPNTTRDTNASYIGPQSNSNPFDYLPEGFLGRTKGRALLVPSWAPQIQVLSHRATGGFLNHCGWNSTLESILNGVPLISWPLHGDQKMVAVQLVEHLKIALRPIAGEDGLIRREEISKVVRDLMVGEEGLAVRNKMNVLKEAAKNAMSEEGSSTKSLELLVSQWKNRSGEPSLGT